VAHSCHFFNGDIIMVYIGWILVAFSGILLVLLIARAVRHEDKDPWKVRIVGVVALCWVLGSLILVHRHIEFLYAVNAIMAGKFIFTQFTGWKW